MYLFGCGTWDLAPWPGVEPGSPALGAQSLSRWATRDDPVLLSFSVCADFLPQSPVSVTWKLMNMNHSSSECHLPWIVFDGELFYASTDNMDWVSMIDVPYLVFGLPEIGGRESWGCGWLPLTSFLNTNEINATELCFSEWGVYHRLLVWVGTHSLSPCLAELFLGFAVRIIPSRSFPSFMPTYWCIKVRKRLFSPAGGWGGEAVLLTEQRLPDGGVGCTNPSF